MSDRSLSGRTALVTGASRGIGLATVEALAERGCQVLAGIRQPSTSLEAHFKKLSEEHETRIQPVFVDLANSDRAAECAKQLAQTEGLQILVNNAGIATGGIFQMTSIAQPGTCH